MKKSVDKEGKSCFDVKKERHFWLEHLRGFARITERGITVLGFRILRREHGIHPAELEPFLKVFLFGSLVTNGRLLVGEVTAIKGKSPGGMIIKQHIDVFVKSNCGG